MFIYKSTNIIVHALHFADSDDTFTHIQKGFFTDIRRIDYVIAPLPVK